MIFLKDSSVNLSNTHPMIWRAIAFAADIWGEWGVDLVLTSVRDGVHPGGSRPSFHPNGRAADLRTWNLPPNARQQCVDRLRAVLGPDYDVLYENVGRPTEHCHIQYDPQTKETK